MSDLFIFAGESSGDHLGSELIHALYAQKKDLKISGILGPLMRREGAKCLLQMEEFQVMGFIDVVKALPKIRRLFKLTLDLIKKENPKAVVLIDYPGFNLRLAKALKKRGFKAPIIQYVCPSVWAWKKGRIFTMEKVLDHLICLFPFEPSLFSKTKLPATYTGHPLIQKIKAHSPQELPHLNQPVISIFPGSRKKEVERNLPLMMKMARKYAKGKYEIAISYANEHLKKIMQELALGPAVYIPSDRNYDLMKKSSFAFAVSGTITLELAMLEVPTIVCYMIRPFDFFLARKIFRIDLPHYCIANYTAKCRIFPEFYGPHFNEEMIDETLNFMFENEEELSLCKRRCKELKKQLSLKDPSARTAKILLEKAQLS